MKRVITLTTDFGTRDGFVGTMKGVILNIHPDAEIVDITHEIAPQNVEEGAFLFAASFRYFPANAIHVLVVDPGVGSSRRAIAAQIGETIFIAPDNGILPLAIFGNRGFHVYYGESGRMQNVPRDLYTPPFFFVRQSVDQLVHLNNPTYWLPKVSNTFHGRDIFAPCAAHAASGVPLQALGEPIVDWKRVDMAMAARRLNDNSAIGRVIHIDRFGNAITSIDEPLLRGMDRDRMRISIRGRELAGLRRTYADVASGEAVALVGSSGYLEIAIRDGNAANTLGIRAGDSVIVSVP